MNRLEQEGVPARVPSHLYGGQAVPEGVMMRGAKHWALAVRKPGGTIHVESHDIRSVAARFPILAKPFLRGVIVLGQSIAIGVRALLIATNESTEDDTELTSRQIGVALTIAAVVFVAVFILGPTALFGWAQRRFGHGLATNVAEGVFRVILFVGYLWVIGRTKDIHRVFEYHGAEHKTIAAYEHGKPLEPAAVDEFAKEHVRCGTNFLIIVMIVTILVFAVFGTHGFVWRLVSRLIAIPLIAAISYEALRLGARFPGSAVMRGLMAPGIWLQKITTQEPDFEQIEVAIASFEEVLRREAEAAGKV
jgi:uncharacterized protein YqhQ